MAFLFSLLITHTALALFISTGRCSLRYTPPYFAWWCIIYFGDKSYWYCIIVVAA